jgi:hypothetical protein
MQVGPPGPALMADAPNLMELKFAVATPTRSLLAQHLVASRESG